MFTVNNTILGFRGGESEKNTINQLDLLWEDLINAQLY